ncbi:MAG: DUF4259 domain-containing protein [Rhizobiaceae bacterium]|nr:DUF4259 domain-containing protein [Rhizobiaceae bacterium]
MGTWSAGSFGNDAAMDFVDGLTDANSLVQSFAKFESKHQLINSDLACEVIAIADIMAAIIGRPAFDTPAKILQQLPAFATPSNAEISSAIGAVEYIRDNSELAELWLESEDEDWILAISDLLLRLDLTKPYAEVNLAPDANDELAEIGGHCHLCNSGIPQAENIELTVEQNFEGIWSSMTLYAHKNCLEKHYDPPHFNADGSPHANLLAQFDKAINS